jgi:hypothetical protein
MFSITNRIKKYCAILKYLPIVRCGTRNVHEKSSSIRKLALNVVGYKDFRPLFDKVSTNLLESLVNSTLKDIGGGVSVILPDPTVPHEEIKDGIFVRDFYPALLEEIRSERKLVLIGNPGTGKSWFQYYYLARLLNPSLLGPLPPDCNESLAPPKIVIRQVGTSNMTIFDIENRTAENAIDVSGMLLECFEPESSLYLMEPGWSREEPHYEMLRIPTLATVAPDPVRYKQFLKNGGDDVYMPAFIEKELQAIGAYLLSKKGCVPPKLRHIYTPESISQRYKQFGGIIRHVLPSSPESLQRSESEQKQAITNCRAGDILTQLDIGPSTVSHFIMLYNVARKGDFAFCHPELQFVSEDVKKALDNIWSEASVDEMRIGLLRNDDTGFLAEQCPKIYELLIAKLLLKGVHWKQFTRSFVKDGNLVGTQDISDFYLKLIDMVEGEPPPFAEMMPNVLYFSLNPNYPFAEMMYKTDENKLVIIQITRQLTGTKEIKVSVMEKLYVRLKLTEDQKKQVTLVVVFHPKMAKTQLAVLTDSEKINVNEYNLTNYTVWMLPPTYEAKFDHNSIRK